MSDIAECLRALTVNDATTSTLAVCEAAAREIERLRGAVAADDKRLADAAARVGCDDFGCDAADHMADKIIGQKAEIERLREALQEVYDSVPSTYDEDHPEVKRHAKALMNIPVLLSSTPRREED